MMSENLLDILLHRARIGKFVSVGVVGATIETILVAICTVVFGTPPLVAKAIGAETSITTMFVINDRWTFAGQGARGIFSLLRRWGKSHLVRIFGLGVAFSVLYALTSVVTFDVYISGYDIWPTVANIIGIGVGMVLNYGAESFFTWNLAG